MSNLDEIWYVDNYLVKNNNEFEIATSIFWLTTTTQITAKATGGSGVEGSRGKGRVGPHHHQHDFMIFSLRWEPSLLVKMATNLKFLVAIGNIGLSNAWKN